MAGQHHRYRSWEHCYGYFQRIVPESLSVHRHHAALHLGFYLASWGMYRGSSFLLQHAYTVHLGVIDLLGASRSSILWGTEFGTSQTDRDLVSPILDMIDGIREAYRPFAPATGSRQPTDTLVTKVILGTLGCLPACDRFFIDGFKSAGFSYSYLNRKFIDCLLSFSQENLIDLRQEQARIESSGGVWYPIMKLVDMYFWQIGFERSVMNAGA
jgi:hypothetical protein